MRRRGRNFLGFVLVGAGALAFYLWRNRRVRHYARALLSPASDCVRDIVKRALKHKTDVQQATGKPRVVVSGLAAPEVRPLTTVDQLLTWSPDPAAANSDPDEPFCRSYNSPLLLPLRAGCGPLAGALPSGAPEPDAADAPSPGPGEQGASGGGGGGCGCGPRLLVCHDMMGGYLADRLVQGSADPGAFRLWQWDQIDVFVYFSHHLVTIPPPGWIAAAHRNGVRVLGTFITEWEAGRALCESSLFCSPAAARRAADQLAGLAAAHGFEGWLLNIENGMRREQVPHLQHFVGHLRARMAALVGPHALVIWYDAITTEGRLAWQDGLTPLNRPFFDAADALFVNYRWGEGAPAAVAAAAGSRAAEVFMGVDVFGRGSYGGGKFNCPVALAAARSAGLSAALFAPGWVYEEFDRSTFEPRQEAFWAPIRAVWPPARPALVQRLPLVTTFNCGAGRAVWLEGRRVSDAPWHNMAAMDVVAATTPTATTTTTTSTAPAITPAGASEATEQDVPPPPVGAAPPPVSVRTTQQLAFCGGSCLALAAPAPSAAPPSLDPSRGPWTHTLFTAHVPVPAAGLDLTYTAACSGTSRVAVLLRTAVPAAAAMTGVTGSGAITTRGGGGNAGCGVAVGPWAAGDTAVVEALRREGYTCVPCAAAPTGATTCPLAEPLAAATSAALAASAAAAAEPSGLPWVSYSAHLPAAAFFPAGPGAAAAAASTLVAVAVVGYRAAVAGGGPVVGPATASASASASGGGGVSAGRSSSSVRGSAAGYVAPAATATATAAAAATAAAMAAAVSSALDGGDEGAPYKAFLGRLVVREHCPSATSASQGTAASPGWHAPHQHAPQLPCPQPLAGACCSRIRWSRPGVSRPSSSRLRSLRSSFNSLIAPSRPLLAAPAALFAAGDDARGRDARASEEELVERSEEVDAEVDFRDDDDDEDWERSSAGGGGFAGGSPVKVAPLGAAVAASGREDEAGAGAGAAAELGGGSAVVCAGEVGGSGEEASPSRLLTCELSWEPQFDVYGTPRHRSYNVWAYFNTAAGSSAAAAVSLPSAAGRGVGDRGGGGGAAAAGPTAMAVASTAPPPGLGLPSPTRDGAWEVLPPDWLGAVWVGEAFLARYRLVQLEVPPRAAAVTLLVQPVGWDSAEAEAMQPLACLPAPRLQPQQQQQQL